MNDNNCTSGAQTSSNFIDSTSEVVYWAYALVLLAVITIVGGVIYYFEFVCNHKFKTWLGKRFNTWKLDDK